MTDDKDWSRIADAMSLLAAENANVNPPAGLESRVLREFDSATRRKQRHIPWWLPAFTAFAMTSAVALLLILQPATPSRETLRNERLFVQIPYVAPPAPYERVTIVREEMPIAALIAAGFEVLATDASVAVKADVLVGQDGRALAIRLIPYPMSD